MYYPNQIVYDKTLREPIAVPYNVWDLSWYEQHLRVTHFLQGSEEAGEYSIALPKSLEEAKDQLEKGIIVAAPVPPSHHWRCGNWLTNYEAGCCSCKEILACEAGS